MFGFDIDEGLPEAPTFTRPESTSPYNITVDYIKNEDLASSDSVHFNVVIDEGWLTMGSFRILKFDYFGIVVSVIVV